MNVFLDTSVVIAACASARGASRAIFGSAANNHWMLLASSYVVSEIEANLETLSGEGARQWDVLRPAITLVPDVLTFEWIAVFGQAKDRPILFTAAACADVLLTLDRRSFHDLLGGAFYGLSLLKPGDFLQRERAAGRLSWVA